MFAKSYTGKGFYGVFRYVMGEQDAAKDAHVIGGNLAGRDAQELSREVKPFRQRRSDIEKPVWHVSLAFHPDEKLNDAQLQDACTRFLDVFGVDRDRHQHVIVRHHDTEHEHAHIVLNRIAYNGKLLDLHRDRYRVKTVARQVEKELGLRITVERGEPFRKALRDAIASVAARYPRMVDFVKALKRLGIEVKLAYREGAIQGISYKREGIAIAGSKLGAEYSFPGLQKYQAIEYDSARDDVQLRELMKAQLEPKERLRQSASQEREMVPER